MTPVRTAALGLSALSLAACVSVPSAPLDPAASAARLAARSLDDPKVAQALSKAGVSAPGSLDGLTVAAWTLRPEIAAAAADVAAGNAAERVAGELPNPSVSLDPGYLFDNANNNVSPWTVAAAIGFTIETGDKRSIRRAQAHAEAESRRWQFAETLWKTRTEVRKAVFARLVAQQTLAIAQQEVTLREAFSAYVENQFRFGAAAQPERFAARIALAQAQVSLRTARGDLTAAEAELAAAVGVTSSNLPLDRIAAVDAALPDPGTLADPATLREWGLVNRLSIRHALTDYDVSEQALRLAVAQQYPDISFGPGYTYDKGDQGLTLALGFTIPLFHGAGAAIDQALAARQKAATQFEVEQGQALSEIDTALARYRAAFAAWGEAKAAQEAADDAAQAAQRRLDLGSADRGELVAAQIEALIARRATLDALRTAIDALATLEDGVQRPIWPASTLTVTRPDDRTATAARAPATPTTE